MNNFKLKKIVWIMMPLEGLAALIVLLLIPSETKNAVLLGFSIQRLIVIGITVVSITAIGLCGVAAFRQPIWWRRISARWTSFFASQVRLFWVTALLFTLLLGIISFFVLANSPAASTLVLLKSLNERFGTLFIWIGLLILQAGLLILVDPAARHDQDPFFSPFFLSILLAIISIVYVICLRIYLSATYSNPMNGMEEYIFLPAAVGLTWGVLYQFFRDRTWYTQAAFINLLALIGIGVYTIYRHTGQWMNFTETPNMAYWHLLADNFLKGRLFIDNPPTNYDLTFFQGHWYLPPPPLPALLLLPLVALFGVANINMVLFSITIGAINAVLIFLVLDQASRKEIISISRSTNLWLTFLFSLGTAHWWLSILSQEWFLSQILSVTFCALAVWLALKQVHPGWVGLSLGLAVLARPNEIFLWPLLIGITLFLDQRNPESGKWRRRIGWAIQSAIPVGIAGAALLFYNYLRFDNFLDFGYVTINGGASIVAAAKEYGIFNLHFVPINFNVMFFRLPSIQLANNCLAYAPGKEGTSILAMTPAVIYVFRRIKRNWWVAGAWCSVILAISLLLMYHSTGTAQLGYRYITDFILPILLLIALGVGQRASLTFKILTLLSILINAAGILWWFGKWPC